ncbi:MAG TPA: pitrilysin family protein [Thermoanaerobaculia bacterium]|nr:pitrilysin family protein [Thermoanaerobaculia bacterium]
MTSARVIASGASALCLLLAAASALTGPLLAQPGGGVGQQFPRPAGGAGKGAGSGGAGSSARRAAAGKAGAAGLDTVTLPSPSSPLVAIRLLFSVGSLHDPAGKEGLAALTAAMVGQGGTAKRSYSQLLEALYPLAAGIDTQTDREVTVFSGIVHRDTLDTYTGLLEEALLTPSFADSDFSRNKEQLLAELTNTLRGSNDELLGLEALQQQLFAGHPYGHAPAGTVASLKSITLDDVRRFYKDHYTQANLLLGVAGGYPAGYVARLSRDLSALPAGRSDRGELPPAPPVHGRRITLIDKETASVGIHFGYPLPITRKDADFYPLMVANSYLGEHRTFNGRLMVELRQARGLNYGDYSYIEYWAFPPFTSHPPPNVPRREQYFSVWVRPVVPADAQFALRAALYEVSLLHDKGLSQQDFDLTRNFLLNYSKLWVQDLSSRLGYQMDSRYYGMPTNFIDEIERRLKTMTVAEVNQAVKKYISPESYDAVIVTAKAAELKELLQKDEPSPKKYNSQVAPEVLEADKTIVVWKVRPTAIEIIPVAQMFEK